MASNVCVMLAENRIQEVLARAQSKVAAVSQVESNMSLSWAGDRAAF